MFWLVSYLLWVIRTYINGLSTSKDVTGLAVIDDFYIEGPYQHVFQTLDRYAGDAKKADSAPRQVHRTLAPRS